MVCIHPGGISSRAVSENADLLFLQKMMWLLDTAEASRQMRMSDENSDFGRTVAEQSKIVTPFIFL